jgi:hypothetical protein
MKRHEIRNGPMAPVLHAARSFHVDEEDLAEAPPDLLADRHGALAR